MQGLSLINYTLFTNSTNGKSSQISSFYTNEESVDDGHHLFNLVLFVSGMRRFDYGLEDQAEKWEVDAEIQ